jgi:hypothetical protein
MSPVPVGEVVVTVQQHGPAKAEGIGSLFHQPEPGVLEGLLITAKLILVLMAVRVLVDPTWAHLDGKAPMARAVMYPMWAMLVPALRRLTRRPLPWRADFLLTLTCFTDLVGNRLDLYNSIEWFDDVMHVLNSALVSAAFVFLIVRRPATFMAIATTAVALGMTASLGWELFEYATFLTRSTEWTTAYSDTMGDLALGWVGAAIAALLIATAWRDRPEAGAG